MLGGYTDNDIASSEQHVVETVEMTHQSSLGLVALGEYLLLAVVSDLFVLTLKSRWSSS